MFSGLTRAAGGGGTSNEPGSGGDGMGAEIFPSGNGRQLGGGGATAGPTRRVGGADARTARLKVLEGSNNNKAADEGV